MGTYTAEQVAKEPGYYNDGVSTLAVLVEVVERYTRDANDAEWRFEAPRLVPRSALPKIRAALRRLRAKSA
jgi:hypothetical protein